MTFKTLIIFCPLVFLGGFVDAVGGGGGLISLPAYLLAGVPTHMAIGTNKLSSFCGTSISTARFVKKRLIDLKLAVPGIIGALIGAFFGAKVSLLTDEKVLKWVLLPVLCVAAFFVLNKKMFGDEHAEDGPVTKKTCLLAGVIALVIGFYDGFYGPGAGAFILIAMNVFAKVSVKRANGQAKAVTCTTMITGLVVNIFSGQVFWALGVIGAACNMLGNFIGSSLAIQKGERITRPIILCVIILLFIKLIADF